MLTRHRQNEELLLEEDVPRTDTSYRTSAYDCMAAVYEAHGNDLRLGGLMFEGAYRYSVFHLVHVEPAVQVGNGEVPSIRR